MEGLFSDFQGTLHVRMHHIFVVPLDDAHLEGSWHPHFTLNGVDVDAVKLELSEFLKEWPPFDRLPNLLVLLLLPRYYFHVKGKLVVLLPVEHVKIVEFRLDFG